MPGRCPVESTAVVAIIGGGASGTLAAAQVARAAARRAGSTEIVLVDPDPIGTGVAYSTGDPRHRLNVRAECMSAWPDEPGHFLAWLRRTVATDYPADGYAPRHRYHEYLADTLEDALRAAPSIRFVHLRERASDVRRIGRRLRIVFADGTSRAVDAVVLATGHSAPPTGWAPAALRRSQRFVADPWRAAHPDGVRSVLLVGAGLTMADMAMRYGDAGAHVHVVSRHGLMPLAHPVTPLPAVAVDAPTGPQTLTSLRRFVFDHVRTGGDWRAAIDGLRPVTSALWASLDDASRGAFVRVAARRWDRVRHRIDPEVAHTLAGYARDGRLHVHTGEVADAVVSDRMLVTLTDGAQVEVDAVINCTGASGAVTGNADPLVMNLLASGVARPGPLDLGFATDAAGRLAPAQGDGAAIWAIGPLRKGELWESTAIPELRTQARDVARAVVDTLPSPRVVRRARDSYGLPLSASSAAAARYTEAVGRILKVQAGAETLVADAVRADPDFALGHAVLALLGSEWGADVDVSAALAAAERAPAADERERRFVEVATARVTDPGRDSAAALIAYIHAYPEDALAVSLAVPTIAFGGATEIPAEAWALVEGLAPTYRDDWWYLSLLAFTRQDQSRFAEAGELAVRALAIEPAAGHAVHAKAHVHYETGDHRAGLQWLDGWIASCGANASQRAHFSWHAALHELALGDDAAVLARYARQLAPPQVCGVRALVDSASLLWRARIAGVRADGGALDAVLATVPRGLLVDPPTAFVALHAAVALTAVGDCHGLAALRRSAAARTETVFTATVAPLADALCDLVHGDADRATARLLDLRGVDQLGGSAAQREIVEDTLIHAAVLSGAYDVAGSVLDTRLGRRPSSRDAQRRARIAVESVRAGR